MANKEKELQEEIIRQVKDSRWSVKGYFHELFKQLIPQELQQNKRMAVVDEFLTEETLPQALSKQYEQDGYVLLFYAHKTYTKLISPFNGDANASHTSLLLCKVDNGKINGLLNIDGYHSLGYMDIIGERPNAVPNTYIKDRLVINAPDENDSKTRKPLQSASWNNLNCPLYAFAFAKSILRAFDVSSEIFDDVFIKGSIFYAALPALKDVILQGVEGTYVKRIAGNLCKDGVAERKFHTNVRETLAQTLRARVEKENVIEAPIIPNSSTVENVSVVYSSIFKPVVNDTNQAITQLMTLCNNYQSWLYEEMHKLINKNPVEIIDFVSGYVINLKQPGDMDRLVQKYQIVTSMIVCLTNPQELNENTRICDLKNILTVETKDILAEHRSTGGKFLQGLLSVLAAVFSLICKVDWKYATKGDELIENVSMVSVP